jgi:Na+/H+-dicarboxylate symporter
MAAFFAGLGEVMLVLVGWVIRVAPLGVLGLAAPLAARMGTGVAGALLSYCPGRRRCSPSPRWPSSSIR